MYKLNTREFVSYLENELSISAVKPQNLILEVTESKIVQDYPLVLDVLTRLRLRRVNLSIDLFGKGSFTKAQLRQSQKMDATGKLTGGMAHDFIIYSG